MTSIRALALALGALGLCGSADAATVQTLTIELAGACTWSCSGIGGEIGDRVYFSATFDMTDYERGGPFHRSNLLDWTFRSETYSFSRADASTERVEDHTDSNRLVWRGPLQMPRFYLTAREVSGADRYLNLLIGDGNGSAFGGYVGTFTDTGDMRSPYPAPVPLPPALALMLVPLAGLGWVKVRRG